MPLVDHICVTLLDAMAAWAVVLVLRKSDWPDVARPQLCKLADRNADYRCTDDDQHASRFLVVRTIDPRERAPLRDCGSRAHNFFLRPQVDDIKHFHPRHSSLCLFSTVRCAHRPAVQASCLPLLTNVALRNDGRDLLVKLRQIFRTRIRRAVTARYSLGGSAEQDLAVLPGNLWPLGAIRTTGNVCDRSRSDRPYNPRACVGRRRWPPSPSGLLRSRSAMK